MSLMSKEERQSGYNDGSKSMMDYLLDREMALLNHADAMDERYSTLLSGFHDLHDQAVQRGMLLNRMAAAHARVVFHSDVDAGKPGTHTLVREIAGEALMEFEEVRGTI